MIKYLLIASVILLGACSEKYNPEAGNLVAYKWKSGQVETTVKNPKFAI
jgi:hypothetical protein